MKSKLLWTSLGLLPLALWLGAQVQSGQAGRKQLAEIAPGNALVWVEAKDLKAMVAGWDGSPEKKTWLESSTYQSYLRSKLALRLAEVQKAYADGIGVNPGYELLTNLAGSESGVAVYDVGKLELLFLTRLPAASIGQTLLMQGRAKFQARNAGGQPYYVKSTSDGTVAFAAVGDLLLAGSREDLVAGALQLLAGQQRPSIRQERWFSDALAKASPGAPDVRMLINVERTVKTAHFRSYWIQQNITDLGQYYAAISDLRMDSPAWTEQRVLLRREPVAAVDETGVARLSKFVPPDMGFYRAWAKPTRNELESLLSERIVPPGGGRGAINPEDSRAPGGGIEASSGDEDQLEDRVDVADSGGASTMLSSPLPVVRLAESRVEAVAEMRATRAASGGVLVAIDSALVLLSSANWDENAVKAAVLASAERAWSAGALTWNRRGAAATWELSGLNPVHVWLQGPVLVIASSASLLDKITAANGPVAQGAVLAGYRHGAERGNYARIMGHIDSPQIPATQNGSTRPPMLFSETLGDLGKILQRVEALSMESKDDGSAVKQTVIYRKRA
jgi:hypothetical protein